MPAVAWGGCPLQLSLKGLYPRFGLLAEPGVLLRFALGLPPEPGLFLAEPIRFLGLAGEEIAGEHGDCTSGDSESGADDAEDVNPAPVSAALSYAGIKGGNCKVDGDGGNCSGFRLLSLRGACAVAISSSRWNRLPNDSSTLARLPRFARNDIPRYSEQLPTVSRVATAWNSTKSVNAIRMAPKCSKSNDSRPPPAEGEPALAAAPGD